MLILSPVCHNEAVQSAASTNMVTTTFVLEVVGALPAFVLGTSPSQPKTGCSDEFVPSRGQWIDASVTAAIDCVDASVRYNRLHVAGPIFVTRPIR